MRRLALAIAVLALVIAAPAGAGERNPTQAEVEREVVCPTCHTTLDQSASPIARQMKAFIAARIAAGDTKTEIERKLVDEFGPEVLAKPGTRGFDLLAWLLPIGGLVAGAVVIAAAAWHWSRRRGADDDVPPPDAELERRVDEELARFGA